MKMFIDNTVYRRSSCSHWTLTATFLCPFKAPVLSGGNYTHTHTKLNNNNNNERQHIVKQTTFL